MSGFGYGYDRITGEKFASRSEVIGQNGMVATSNPLSSNEGIKILQKGGNAVDASTAIGFALAVTLPRAGNLGGGGFMLIYDKNKGEISSIDYRSAAPAIAKSSDVVGKNGKTIRYGHKVTAVPGSVAGLLKAHSERGTLSLKEDDQIVGYFYNWYLFTEGIKEATGLL